MKQTISEFLAGIVDTLGINPATVVVESSENSIHGDYTSNIAMISAGHLKASPMSIAQKIVDIIRQHQKMSPVLWLDRVEAAPPGFINITLSEATFSTELAEVLKQKDRYGAISYTRVTHSTGLQEAKKTSVASARKKSQEIQKNTVQTESKKGQKLKNNSRSIPESAEKTATAEKSALRGNDFENRKSKIVNRSQNVFANPDLRIPICDAPRTIMVEFAHPNTHKAFHIGHLRNITTGECVVRLLESQGHTVIRANYQGDVGMHIAKALYALLNVSPFKDDVHKVTGIKNRVEFLGKAYAAGSKAFEEDKIVQEKIKDFNYFIYASAEKYAAETGLPKPSTDYLAFIKGDKSILHTVYELWKETRQWSLDYFDLLYKRVYSHFDRFYFESQCLSGVDRAKDAVKRKVLKESDGAIIFDGKPHGLDTRVFVNSLGLPTYEGKELALAGMETSEFGTLDKLIHCVGPEQSSFFKVTFKAEELLGIVKPGVQYHLAYGWVKLKKGKMSSRLGNVVVGEWLIDEVKKAINTILDQSISKDKEVDQDSISETIAIGAIKYSFLKVSTPSEIAFDLEESINTNGDSGPYLQYAYARCRSVLRKFQTSNDKVQNKIQSSNLDFELDLKFDIGTLDLNNEERAIARLITQFPDVVTDAANRFAPNVICTYLFQLAQAFNLFYAKHSILGSAEKSSVVSRQSSDKSEDRKLKAEDSQSAKRIALTAATAQVLKNGLYLLGINVLERM
jgi:arginyl-tRNA synthetase